MIFDYFVNLFLVIFLSQNNRIHSYGPIGYQNLAMLQDLAKEKLDQFLELHYKDIHKLPQPQVFCHKNMCTYSFNVAKTDDVRDLCAKPETAMMDMLADISQKLDTLLEVKVDDQTLEQAKSTKILNEDLSVETTLGQLCHNVSTYPKRALRDCLDIWEFVSKVRGIYEIEPVDSPKFFAYCEDGWTVFQRREDGSVDFDRNWSEYESGFGLLSTEFWLGNENIHKLTTQKRYKLQIELGDWMGRHANAIYETFSVDGAMTKYTAHIGRFLTGVARDGLLARQDGGSLDGMPFSTYDRDHDRSGTRNCAGIYGGGWWYNDCFMANLNGQYVYRNARTMKSFIWRAWRGPGHYLKLSKIMVKPT